jgi:hypothetical protein
MRDVLQSLELALGDAERSWWRDALARCERAGADALAAILPALPRRLGRLGCGTGVRAVDGARVDLGVWRLCDVGAWALLARARVGDDAVLDLFARGDIEERTMLLRATAARPLSPATGRLLVEIQRSNTVPHFEALACDNDLVVRACGQVDGFDREQGNRLLLKAAFLGLRLRRFFSVERLANPELSRMLSDLATEREAAGRAVWSDTAVLLARAPVAGTVARLLGDLEHGDDERRLAAALSVPLLGRADLVPFLTERLPREPKPAIAQALRDAVAQLG